jgi:hypothetical protein
MRLGPSDLAPIFARRHLARFPYNSSPSRSVAKQTETSESGQPISIGPFVLRMGAYVLLGIPLVAVLWSGINHLLALRLTVQVLWAIPAAILLFGLLVLVNRSIKRWLAEPDVPTTRTDA